MKTIRLSYLIYIGCIAIIVTGVEYYLLIKDNFLHLSISSIIEYSGHLATKAHLLVLGLLPIYISMVVFGITILGYYITNKIYSFWK